MLTEPHPVHRMLPDSPDSPAHRSTSAWHLPSIVIATVAAGASLGPIKDHDVFLHIAVGRQLLDHGHTARPDAWAFTRPEVSWSTSSWGSDVVLAQVYRWAGERGVVLLEFAGAVAVLIAVYVLLRHHRPRTQAIVFTLACLSLWPFFEERPQLASLLLVVWLAALRERLRAPEQRLNLFAVLGLTYVWAWVHGSWVLVPATLLLVAAGRRLDGERLRSAAVRLPLAGALLAPAMAMLTPVGPKLLLAPVSVTRAAQGRLAEWLPSRLDLPLSWGFTALFLVVLVAWARGPRRPPRSDVLWMIALGCYAATAWRNLGPASILIAPVAARALDGWWADRDRSLLPRTAVVGLAIASVLALTASAATRPTAPEWGPHRIAATLAAQDGTVRVLSSYDVGSYLATAGAPAVRVAVDGRADRYGGGFLDRYFSMTAGQPGWESTLAQLRPDVAVLAADAPLVTLLTDRGWHGVLRDHGYALLSAPGVEIRQP